MSGRHRLSPTMRTDDDVAPGVRRSRAPLIIGLGLAAVVIGIVVIALTLSTGVKDATDKASLSQDETRQLREFLADRGEQRDAERAEVQQQLDDQRAVLCAAISTLSASARPEARTILLKAASDLRCAALPRHTATTGTTSSPSRPSPSSTTLAGPASTGNAAAAPRASVRPSRTAPSAGAPGTPRATSRPSSSPPLPSSSAPKPSPRPAPTPTSPRPQPSPSPAQPGLLDPVTAPVCNLLHVCL